MEPIITSVTLGILANALYDLMKGEGPLTDMAKYIDEHVLNKSKLFNRQTVAQILQDSRNAQLLEKLENYQQTKEKQMLISIGEEFSKVLELPENQVLQECVHEIIIHLEQEDHKLLATLITVSASQQQIELGQIRDGLNEIKKIILDDSAKIEQADIIRLTEELSNIALKLRDSIGCYKRSVEDKVAEIIELLRSGENIVLVLGEAGSGKSALLKHLYKALKDTDFKPSEVDPAKVVYLDVGSYRANSPEALRQILELKLDLSKLLRKIASISPLALILDGLDEALGYEDATQVWNNIILEATTIPKAQVIVSCREYDWANTRELEPLRKKLEPENILIRRWDLNSVREALTANNLPYPDENVLEFLRNPFLLDLYVEMADDLSDVDRSSLRTEVDLYNRYWDLRVSTGRPPATREQMIQAARWLAEQAEKERVQRFDPDTFLLGHSDGAEGLKGNSVILSDRRGVYFRHPLLLDYSIIRRREWLTNPDKLADLLREESYNPFLRSSVFLMIKFLIADGEWNQVQSLLCATAENRSVGWIINLLDFLARNGWSKEMSECLEEVFGTLRKDKRQTYLVHLVRCFPHTQPEWCEFLLTLPEYWIAEEEGTSLHKAVSDFMESLALAYPSIQTVSPAKRQASVTSQALLIRTGQRFEGIARNIQTKNQTENKGWTDWPTMRYIYTLGKTKNPNLIDWLLEVASLSWGRVKMACMDQVPWVADENPSSGAQLMALSLSFEEDVPETW